MTTKEQIIDKANEFARARIVPNQTNIYGELAISYARDAALDMAEYMQRQIDQANEDGELLAYNCEKRVRQEIIDKACKWLEEQFYHSNIMECFKKIPELEKEFEAMLNENKKQNNYE